MSKYLIELGLEESIEDWLNEMRWKRNHDYKAFKSTLAECATLLREEIASARAIERARCAEICADIAGEVDWQARGIMQMDAEQVGIECACRIRGEKC